MDRLRKGDYTHGIGVLDQVGQVTRGLGRTAILIADAFPGSGPFLETVRRSLEEAGVRLLRQIAGAAPNCPREDVSRMAEALGATGPEVAVSFGGGSTIDAAKAACVLHALGGALDPYFGTGLVTQALGASGKGLKPHVAIQTAASSGAHLTKYSNITDLSTGQKKLIVDNAIVPARAVFDYSVTAGAPPSLTLDGGLDGIAHCLEVLYDSVGKPHYDLMEEVAREGIGLVLTYLPKALEEPRNLEAREALGLATDLGACALMIGGTSGPHLTSFSLVDILSHGRACGLMNPYYTVFFAPAVQQPLRMMARLLASAGYAGPDIEKLTGRELGEAVARAMLQFMEKMGAPATLRQVPGFSDAHIERALSAAKLPELKMKLENMPVPLTAELVDEYMGPVLRAAATGDLNLIKCR